MKKLIFILLFLPLFSLAQKSNKNKRDTIPETEAKEVADSILPKVEARNVPFISESDGDTFIYILGEIKTREYKSLTPEATIREFISWKKTVIANQKVAPKPKK